MTPSGAAFEQIVSPLRLDSGGAVFDARLDWNALLDHADAHSLTPLLYNTWRANGVLDGAPADARARLAKAFADNSARQENIRNELLEIDQLLAEADIPHIVLKGWPLVERLYAHPAERVIYDHDFLVPPDWAEIGRRALLAAGFHRLPAKDEWIEKHLPSLWRNNGYQWNGYLFDPHYPRPVELHVRLWEDGWRGLRVRGLPDAWADAPTRLVAGRPMLTLSDENAAIHLAVHFAGHLIEREARLNQLLDLGRFVALAESIDWESAARRAAHAGVGRFLYASLWLANRIFASPLPPPGVWRRLAAETPPALRSWLGQHGAADVLAASYRRRSRGKDYQLTFLSARTLAEWFGIARFAVLPPAAQLMSLYGLRRRWLAPLLYPRYVAERIGSYGRALLRRNVS